VTRVLLFTLALASLFASLVTAQRLDVFIGHRDAAAIQYTARAADTAVSALARDLEAGRTTLAYDAARGYLPALLRALRIPVESQQLVFSQTSAQAALIKPSSPRAIYFNDSTAVGFVPGAATIEIAAHDPTQGTHFYTIDQQPGDRPRVTRRNECLQCHLTWDTLGVPGWTLISTFPMSDDKNAYASGVTVDHRTPFDMRWGGWYVTGTSVPVRHYGNLPVVRPAREIAALTAVPRPPVMAHVGGVVAPSLHLSATSDVAASLVLAHQVQMINHLTRLGWEARLAGERTPWPAPAAERIQQAVSQFVDYLLFVDEAPLPQRIEGNSGFAQVFAAGGPKDARGRSLRDLDLTARLLRYPCSYLVYSPAFDALPPPVLEAVYQRMWRILSGQETDVAYAKLARADRTAVLEILRATKKNLPAYFNAVP
jgi:hypothetical protein